MKNILTGLSLIIGIGALSISLANIKKSKQLYIDMGKVYNEFQLSKELNQKMDEVVKARKKVTDSLYAIVRQETELLKQKPKQSLEEMARVAKLEEKLYVKQQEFEKDNAAINADFSNKIWAQINQYVADYGAKKECTFILGANGQGNIMYADKTYDITNEIVQYVNDRYNDRVKE